MKKIYLALTLLSLMLVGCGKKPHIASPADGQVFVLANNQFTYFDVTYDTNDYSNGTTSFKGTLPTNIQCAPGSNAPARCSYIPNAQNAGIQQNSYTVAIVVSDSSGNVLDVHTVIFQMQAAIAGH